MSENLSFLSGRKGLKDSLFERYEAVSDKRGAAARVEMKKLAREFLFGEANILGAISFYDFLRPGNADKKVFACNGTSCLMAGTQAALIRDLKDHFEESEIGEMACLGRCYQNGAFHYRGNNYSADSKEQLDSIIRHQKASYNNPIPVVSDLAEPVLSGTTNQPGDYYSILERTLSRGPEEVLEEIDRSKLRGRGGAGFPMAWKLRSVMEGDAAGKFIVCNADEGDPGSYIDRYLMELQPYAVLFGMAVAGFVAGAETGIIYLRAEYPESFGILERAIEEFNANSPVGTIAADGHFNFHFKIIRGAGSYICGEETALLSSIEGQRPEVRIRPPYPSEKGLFNLPTLVNNVETFANLYFICRHGGEVYARLGTKRSSGPKLVCLDSYFINPGVFEVEMGTPLNKIVYELGGGFKSPVKALQIGGPLGGIVPVGKIDDLTLDFESFEDHDFLLGHGSIVSIPEHIPMVKYLAHLFEFTAMESCGKCFPCRLGTVRGMEMLEKAYASRDNGRYKIDRALFNDLLETLETTSLCALGGGLPLPVRNVLEYFSNELKDYFEQED